MKKIITISREFGAGGREIGQQLAEKLGYEYFDKNLIIKAARKANLSLEDVKDLDEKTSTGFLKGLFDFYAKPLNEKLFAAQKEVIRNIGEHGNCVIVGRNANAILREYDDSLHVFIHADPYWRLQRLKAEDLSGMSEAKIAKQIAAVDRSRAKYCSYFTDTEFGVSRFYDVSLSTSSLGIDRCAEIILSMTK